MKGLIIKDLLTLKKSGKMIIALVVFYLIISFISKDASILAGMISILFAMFPITALAYDERAKWDKYALAMPVSRDDMVISKYILGLMLCFAGFLLNLLFQLVSGNWNIENLLASVVIFGVGIVFFSVIMPIMYRFGVEKGRIVMIVFVSIPFIIGIIINQFGDMSTRLEQAAARWEDRLPIILPLIVLAIFIGSLLTSMHIYNKKEW